MTNCSNVKDQFTAYLECKRCYNLVARPMGCNKRFEPICPECAAAYRKKWYRRYRHAYDRMLQPKLVTLTLRKKGDIGGRLRELTKYARRCRKYMQRRGYPIRAFLWVMEPPNHIHALWDCGYIPQHKLAEVWGCVTGDSMIVDIRKASNRQGANYLLKYLGKATKWDQVNLSVMHGVHITGSWGVLDPDAWPGMLCEDPGCGCRKHLRVPEEYYRMSRRKPPPNG